MNVYVAMLDSAPFTQLEDSLFGVFESREDAVRALTDKYDFSRAYDEGDTTYLYDGVDSPGASAIVVEQEVIERKENNND